MANIYSKSTHVSETPQKVSSWFALAIPGTIHSVQIETLLRSFPHSTELKFQFHPISKHHFHLNLLPIGKDAELVHAHGHAPRFL